MRATSRMDTGEPEQTLYAAMDPVGREASDSSAARLARATSSTWTKSRTCPPSSKTRGASPRSREERKIAATPEYGVSRGMPGPYTLWYLSATAADSACLAHADV